MRQATLQPLSPIRHPGRLQPRLLALVLIALSSGSRWDNTANAQQTAASARARVVAVRKIWDNAPHNAFTDLQRFQGKWICAFREGGKHAGKGDHGKVRVIASTDGTDWKSMALLESPGVDLRDAKLSVTPTGQLLLNSCEYDVDNDSAVNRNNQSVVFLSGDGEQWEGPLKIADKGYWLWQTTWTEGTGYALGYRWGEQDATRLYVTKDGRDYRQHLDHPRPPTDRSNEHAMIFDARGTAHMLLRRDGATKSSTASHALLGTAAAPYRDWEWRRLPIAIGGPAMLQLPDGSIMTCIRRYANEDQQQWGSQWTELGFLDARTAGYTPGPKLPSGGDSSYAGLVLHEGRVFASYYSSHEGKTSIYFAEIELLNEHDAAGS